MKSLSFGACYIYMYVCMSKLLLGLGLQGILVRVMIQM